MAENHDGQAEVAYAVGDVVSGTVTRFDRVRGLLLRLNVDGWVGVVPPQEIALADLADGGFPWDHLIASGLFVLQVVYGGRLLILSVKRNAPGYVDALQRHAVGEVVSGTVTGFWHNSGLWLDVDGLVGSVAPDELELDDGESAQERYAVGETITDLLVWRIDHEKRDLGLSVRRDAPSYVEALQRHAVGNVVSGTVTGFQSNGGLWLDVDGLVGSVAPDELGLDDKESARDRYAVDKIIDGLLVWDVDYGTRALRLSIKRNAPSYVKALNAIARGDEIDGIVSEADGRSVELGAGLVGWIPTRELALDDEDSSQTRYTPGDSITARVRQIDHAGRDLILSVRRLAADFFEGSIKQGTTINVTVRGTTPDDAHLPVRVLAVDSSVSIPPHEMSLSTGTRRAFKDREEIRSVVVELGDEGLPTRLSHRRALDGWEDEVGRLSPGTLVPNARIVPIGALSDTELRAGAAAADLGPITGFISEGELDRDSGQDLMTYSGNVIDRVVIESVDRARGTATVSRERFEERWRAVAGQLALKEGSEVDGELRDFDRETALLNLGSGLLAQMPARELPDSDPPGKAARDRIGEPFPLRITAIDRDTQTVHVEPRNQWLVEMIEADENLTVEFKAVFRGPKPDDGAKKHDTYSGMPVIRAMAGLMNAKGGHVLVGVTDPDKATGEVVGWEASGFRTQNAMLTELGDIAGRKLTHPGLITPSFETLPGGKQILVIECSPAKSPVFVLHEGKELFYVREPASTQPYDGRKRQTYIEARFYGRTQND